MTAAPAPAPARLDLLCATGAFLDLTFLGLEALPAPGRERFAADLLRSPGGGAVTALAAARLGLAVALARPLGDDEAGAFVRAALEVEGVEVTTAPGRRTPTTVVLPLDGDRAMVTFDPDDPDDPLPAEAITATAARAVIGPFALLPSLPPAARAYVSVGDREVTAHAGRSPDLAPGPWTLFANEAEALRLAGFGTIEAAARRLGEQAETVAVTLGPRGAVAVSGGELVRVPGEPVAVVDTTGAGDVFAGTWVWGDLAGLDLEARLRYAVLGAALSVTAPTGAAGAVDRARLLAEGARRGLPQPPAPEPLRRSPALG